MMYSKVASPASLLVTGMKWKENYLRTREARIQNDDDEIACITNKDQCQTKLIVYPKNVPIQISKAKYSQKSYRYYQRVY